MRARASRAALVAVVALAGAVTSAAPPSGAVTHPVGARPSPGCAPATTTPDQPDVPFSADGDNGAYTLEAPAATGPLPVIFDLHAYEEPGQLQVTLSGLGQYGQAHGFMAVTPWITGRPVPLWHSVPGSHDLAWFGDLLSHVEATTCVDENRVFVTGYSNGAFMTSLIACRYSSRVAAVAPVAGIQADPPCKTARPVPVVAFHGTADPLVHYNGTPSKAAADLPGADGTGRITAREATQFGTRGIFAKGPSIPGEAAAWGQAQRLLDRGDRHPDRSRHHPPRLGVPATRCGRAVPDPGRWPYVAGQHRLGGARQAPRPNRLFDLGGRRHVALLPYPSPHLGH